MATSISQNSLRPLTSPALPQPGNKSLLAYCYETPALPVSPIKQPISIADQQYEARDRRFEFINDICYFLDNGFRRNHRYEHGVLIDGQNCVVATGRYYPNC